jgi:PAS domain S-box-containing protein
MLSTPPELARSALDAAPDAMVIIDATGLVRFANRQVSAVFGHSHEQIIGQSVEQLMPDRYRARHAGHRRSYVESLRVRPMGPGLELLGRRSDGSEFPVEISLSPIEAGGELLVAAAIRDVTDRKRAEAELIEAREAAERARESADRSRRVADSAKRIADLEREKADRANQGKSRFLATASHDLRQPLQTLSLLHGSLRRMVTDPHALEALVQQEQAITAMSRLLNTLLDISKLESGAIKPEPTDFTVAALFRGLRSDFANLAANKGLNLQVEECTDCVHSDPSLVEQILRNLVSNAIKYTREGWVRLRCLHEQATVRIDVLDTGVGIPYDQLGHIYDEFYQIGVPTNASRDGYGLGLSIVQRLVKLLDLRLDVQSEVGKGTKFSLLLPAGNTRADAPRAPVGQMPSIQPSKGQVWVLLVEDDPAVRQATRMLLRVEGFEVIAVSSRAEALRAIADGPVPDLLLTDYHLGDGETGTQVLAALRERLGVPLKAVLITGDTSSAIKELHLDPHLRVASKPIEAEDLLAQLRGLLEA